MSFWEATEFSSRFKEITHCDECNVKIEPNAPGYLCLRLVELDELTALIDLEEEGRLQDPLDSAVAALRQAGNGKLVIERDPKNS